MKNCTYFTLLFQVCKCFLIIKVSCSCDTSNKDELNIDCLLKNNIKHIKFDHFWKSTGLSPSDPKNQAHNFLLSPDEKFNLLFIASLPYEGIKQVRIHWLLYLINYNKLSNEYEFKYLDELFDFMQENSLQPGFELMGLPLNMKPENIKDIYAFWFNLVTIIANHYIDRYGYFEVQKWRFETMNEPDLKQYNFLNFTLSEYLQYFQACSDALNAVSISKFRQQNANFFANNNGGHFSDSLASNTYQKQQQQLATDIYLDNKKIKRLNKLKLGGPAGLFKRRDRHPLCWGLLEMCNSSASGACHLQYISFHKKGNGNADQVLSEDLLMLDIFREKYYFLRNISIANDEADILTNWSLDEEWRADVRYAALVSKVVIRHLKEIVVKRRVRIEVLSNDNAFINFHPFYFSQRTLLARFQMNNTIPQHLQFIKKPVYGAMALLSLLGNEYLPIAEEKFQKEQIEILATRRHSNNSNIISILIVNCVENNKTRHEITKFGLINFSHLNASDFFAAVYTLNNNETNPYQVWKHHQSPPFPTNELRRKMRNVEGPARILFTNNLTLSINEKKLVIRLKLKLQIPSIYLLHICNNPALNSPPGRVTNLRAYFVTNGEVLLVWNDKHIKSRCIKTFEVECQSSANETFKRINDEDTILLSYQHTSGLEHKSRYRVRAIDYWNRPGEYSRIINKLMHL